jgi:PAS domain-containing protein
MAVCGRKETCFEVSLRTKQGGTVDLLLSTAPKLCTYSDQVDGVIVVGIDITDSKKRPFGGSNEEMKTLDKASNLERLIDTALHPIFGVDLDGNVNAWNKKATALSGYSKAEVVGKSLVRSFITHEYQASVHQVLSTIKIVLVLLRVIVLM